MIEDLLDLGRIEAWTLALERKDTNLRDLVNQAVALAQPRTSRHRILVQGPDVVTARVDPLHATVVSPPAHGVVTLSPNGAFTYVPAENFIGTDSFYYSAETVSASSVPAQVSITITVCLVVA